MSQDSKKHRRAPSADKLPPNSTEAEQGLLGSILLDNAVLASCQQQFQQDEVFYDLRHQAIWNVMTYLQSKGKAIDDITVQQELKDRQQLDQVGGVAYIVTLPQRTPSAAHAPAYSALVWEKYVWRKRMQAARQQLDTISENDGADEAYVARIEQEHKQWLALLNRGNLTPKYIKPCAEFADEYMAQWFDRHEESYGLELPFEFPLRFRPAATSLMTGDNGSGKSTMLCLIANTVAQQLDLERGEKIIVASMEMRPATTLWIMARQLLGSGKLDDTPANRQRVVAALAWLNTRVLLYDFLGITNQGELMNAFEYAADHQNGKFFIIDNMMKVGIADDDYAGQGQFIQRVCDFNLKRNSHTIVVVHENKGDGTIKQKVRGSKQLTDAPDNVFKMERNEKKAIKLEELKSERNAAAAKNKEEADRVYTLEASKLKFVWDSKFVLTKQRYPGAQQNGSKWLYFNKESLRMTTECDPTILPLVNLKIADTK